MNATYVTPEGTLRIEQEVIEITSSLPGRDPAWVFTDAAGHEHRWVDNGIPTACWVEEDGETYWCEDCCEEHNDGDGHWECATCAERLRPGMRGPSLYREFVPGLKQAFWNDEPITGERADEILAGLTKEEA